MVDDLVCGQRVMTDVVAVAHEEGRRDDASDDRPI
jgi:hypothetical protein